MRVAVITTSRADWNGMGMVARSLRDRGADVAVFAAYGHKALHAIEADGFTPLMYGYNARDDSLSEPDQLLALVSVGLTSLALRLEVFKPDLAVVIGDRHEMLAAAFVIAMNAIPLAHIAGGDVSGGSLDENWRHAISKMSNIHFPTTHEAKDRLVRMGEAIEDIYVLGSPSVDRIAATALPTRSAAMSKIGLPPNVGQFMLVNWQDEHPDNSGYEVMLKVLKQMRRPAIVIGPNPDPHSRALAHIGQTSVLEMVDTVYHPSLPPELFLAALKHCMVMVGNSSAGFYEAPYFGTPVVNVGDRQRGRFPRPQCMRQVRAVEKDIQIGIEGAIAAGRWPIEHPYGRGNSADRIAQTILCYQGRTNMRKRFRD